MEFLSELKENKSSQNMKEQLLMHYEYTEEIPRTFDHIKISENQYLSVQASVIAYCNPKKTVDDLTLYETMEVAPIEESLGIVNLKIIAPKYPRFKEFEKHESGGVYGYVPVELINDLYLYLINK